MDRLSIFKKSRARVKQIKFGDPVTNICAGENNPHRHAYFVKYGIRYVTTTDKKGKFWETDINVIYPSHLGYAKSHELFKPVWESQYGKPYPDHRETE